MRQGIVEQNPTDKVINPKNIKRLPFFYEEKQMKTMLDGEKEQLCTQCNEENGSNNYIAQRNHAIFEVFYGTGMRLSELIGLRSEDINFSRQSIKVLGKGSKERIVPLTPHLSKELEHYMSVYRQYFCPSPNNPLFLTLEGKTMSPSSVYRMVNKALKNQGISGRKSPHILRHTFATHLLNNGADLNSIKTLLGHASLSATQIYTHNDVKKLQRVYDKAHPHAE
jgi:integrase/recombinase XerC